MRENHEAIGILKSNPRKHCMQINNCTIVLDDGEFLIDTNESQVVKTAMDGKSAAGSGAGFLFHRCPPDPLMTNGLECVGEYSLRDGQWAASIQQTATVFRVGYIPPSLGMFGCRLDAIAALWKARREAWLLHI